MKHAGFFQWVAVGLATIGLCFPQAVMAAPPTSNQTTEITDVRLHDGGALRGQVVTVQNVPLAGAEVVLSSGNQKIDARKTDQNGYFTFVGLHGGVYQVVAANNHRAYRAWPQGAAPPVAQSGALIVAGNETVRGQSGGLRTFLANPWVIAAIVAAAVAIPVGIHNSRSASG